MYITGALLPVPHDAREQYRTMAEAMADMFISHGAIETMDAWEADIADGKVTDMRQAVAAKDGEAIVFAWIVWPDKDTSEKAFEAMQSDPAMADLDAPFDGMRMIMGGFEPLASRGRKS